MKVKIADLKKIIAEEVAKTKKNAPKAKEVDAGDYADSLEHHINFLEKLGIKEAKLREELNMVLEQKRQTQKKIARG